MIELLEYVLETDLMYKGIRMQKGYVSVKITCYEEKKKAVIVIHPSQI